MMTGAWRLLLTAFRCGVAPRSQLTPPQFSPDVSWGTLPPKPLQWLTGLRNTFFGTRSCDSHSAVPVHLQAMWRVNDLSPRWEAAGSRGI